MRKTHLAGLALGLLCAAGAPVGTQAGVPPLGGYYYGSDTAPSGWEWQSTDSVAYNKEQPHAWFFNFADTESARRVLPEESSLWQSLDGEWRFHWANHPERRARLLIEQGQQPEWANVSVPMCWNVAGLQKDGSQRWGKPIYVNQKVIFQHQVRPGDWKGGVMREPAKQWLTHKDRNEVGTYRRSFTVPQGWAGQEVYLQFDGVDSFFYLYVNGRYVGFSKNSRSMAEFRITPYLKDPRRPGQGQNEVEVEVYRNSTGSFLEAQDMFRLPGIFRTVALTAKPPVQVRDLQATPEVNLETGHCSLALRAEVLNLTGKKSKAADLVFSLYENRLYADENTLLPQASLSLPVERLAAGADATLEGVLNAGDGVHLWSAEAPWRYTLVGELRDKSGRTLQTFSTIVGFRQIELRDVAAKDDAFGKAGRYYFLNGQNIKMKGVNRHENSPETGHYVTREQMKHEVMLMKRANINHVRCCHYPDAPYWYYLCDKYGIYLEDEANVESHEYYYGEASLSHVPEFRNMHVARNMEMVRAEINHPSVCIWSLGNEAGPGDNFKAAYQAIKQVDKSRPVQYERNNNIVDMGSNQYPSVDYVQYIADVHPGIVYPFHISEYAHSMGNACGNLGDIQDAIESSNAIVGGAIWDWVDQAIYNYDARTGQRYWGYGGDFGDQPNDGMFCMNGIMRPDLTPKAQYFEVKRVFQNVSVRALDMTRGEVEIYNKNYFEPLRDVQIVWTLMKDGAPVLERQPVQGAKMALGPQQRMTYRLPYHYEQLDPAGEYHVLVEFLLGHDKPWAKQGYVQMEQQLLVRKALKAAPALAQAAAEATKAGSAAGQAEAGGVKLTQEKGADEIVVEGPAFRATFSRQDGSLSSLSYGERTIIEPGCGPKLDAFRAPVDNDNWAYGAWLRAGLHNLHHRALSCLVSQAKDGVVRLAFTVESQAPYAGKDHYSNGNRQPDDAYTFEDNLQAPLGADDFRFLTNQVWSVYPDGSIELQSAITSSQSGQELPRLGYALQLPKDLSQYDYYGLGPVNNYNDRSRGQNLALWHASVKDMDIMLPKPQDMANREGVRWCALSDHEGRGVLFVSDSVMSASAQPWSDLELTRAAHPYQLPESRGTFLHLDAKVTGLGGTSCGQAPPLAKDRTKATARHLAFALRPVMLGAQPQQDLQRAARVSLQGEKPLTIERSRTGVLTIASPYGSERRVMYSVDGGKAKTYTGPVAFSQGGKVKAWYQNAQFTYQGQFARLESVPLEVAYCSSQETDAPASRLLDGDKSTIWHTMYSVTLAKYPHWVDFDAAEQKNMRGFVYTARQDGQNGRVKDYEIFVSQDGKQWGEPVAKGTFQNTGAPQRVVFAQPVKARYIRLRALSEQNGQEYASGAEFSLIAD